jgi:hypothetical protein
MDQLTILFSLAAVLFIYQTFFRIDKDKLDRHGREVYKRSKTRRGNEEDGKGGMAPQAS